MFRAGFVWYSGKNSGMIFTVNTDRRAYVEAGILDEHFAEEPNAAGK